MLHPSLTHPLDPRVRDLLRTYPGACGAACSGSGDAHSRRVIIESGLRCIFKGSKAEIARAPIEFSIRFSFKEFR
jgi:hypothetical protein